MTDKDAIAYATKRRRGARLRAELAFLDWAIACGVARRRPNEPIGNAPKRDRREYMRLWRRAMKEKIRHLEAAAMK